MIAKAARQLPPQMPAPPSYQKVNPGDQPVIFLVLRSTTLPLLGRQRVRARPRSRSGCRWSAASPRSACSAATKYAVRIDVDPRQLAAHGIGIDEVANAVSNANVNLPTGTIYGDDQTFTVLRPTASCSRPAAYGPIIIAYRNGNPVRLDEVAHVYDGVENDKTAGLVQRRPARSSSRSRSSPAPTSSRSSTRSRRCCRRSARSCRPRSASTSAAIAPDRIRESVHDVQVHAAADGRARRPGDLPVPAEPVGDGHSRAWRCRCRSSRPSR